MKQEFVVIRRSIPGTYMTGGQKFITSPKGGSSYAVYKKNSTDHRMLRRMPLFDRTYKEYPIEYLLLSGFRTNDIELYFGKEVKNAYLDAVQKMRNEGFTREDLIQRIQKNTVTVIKDKDEQKNRMYLPRKEPIKDEIKSNKKSFNFKKKRKNKKFKKIETEENLKKKEFKKSKIERTPEELDEIEKIKAEVAVLKAERAQLYREQGGKPINLSSMDKTDIRTICRQVKDGKTSKKDFTPISKRLNALDTSTTHKEITPQEQRAWAKDPKQNGFKVMCGYPVGGGICNADPMQGSEYCIYHTKLEMDKSRKRQEAEQRAAELEKQKAMEQELVELKEQVKKQKKRNSINKKRRK